MKKHLLIGAALFSLMAAGCSNDDAIEKGNEGATGNTVTLNATISNGADTRLAYNDGTNESGTSMKVSWSENERFMLYKGLYGCSSEFSKSKAGNVFTGEAPTSGEGKYYALYGEDDEGHVLYIYEEATVIDISSQVGTSEENGIKEVMVAVADDLQSTFQFKHLLTVLKLQLKLPESVSGKADKVVISGMNSKAAYKWSSDTYDYEGYQQNEIEATNKGNGFPISDDTHTVTAYIAVFPQQIEEKSVFVKVMVGSKVYGYTIESSRTFVAGRMVPVNVPLTRTYVFTAADFYQWDAYLPYQAADNKHASAAYPWGPETPWFNPAGKGVSASASCKDCITEDEVKKYINAGTMYWDSGCGTVATGYQSFQVASSLYDNTLTTYHSGMWLLKKSAWPEQITGTQERCEDVKQLSGLSEEEVKRIRTGGDYFFLPAVGFYNNYGYNDTAGSWGYYWSSTSIGTNSAVYLVITSTPSFTYASILDSYLNKYTGSVRLILSEDGTLK